MVYVHRTVPCMTMVLGVKFIPGMNAISDAEMALIEKHPGFTSEIECKNMTIGGHYDSETSTAVDVEGDNKARAAKIAQEILSMELSVAKKALAETGDGYVLRAVKELDGRKGIQEAVEARMKSIDKQEGSDLAPESIPAPEGNGEEMIGNIPVTKDSIEGNVVSTAIPALNPKRR